MGGDSWVPVPPGFGRDKREGWGDRKIKLHVAQQGPLVPVCPEAGAQLTQAQTELAGGEEAGVGLVQALKHSLQLFWCQG